MDDDNAVVSIAWGLFWLCLFLWLSAMAWYGVGAYEEACPADDRAKSMTLKCGLGNLFAIFLGLFSLLAWILHWILEFLFGDFEHSTTTTRLFLVCLGLLCFIYMGKLFTGLTVAASHVVSTGERKPSSREVKRAKRAADKVKEDLETRTNQTEMETAVRELEEAKARRDELLKKD